MDESVIISAYKRRDNEAQSIEDFCAGLIQDEIDRVTISESRAAQLETELTMTSRALEQHQKTRAELIETVDALRRENKALLDALSEIKRTLAVGRNVGEDKDQAYEDAEEIADVTSDYYRSGQAQQ